MGTRIGVASALILTSGYLLACSTSSEPIDTSVPLDGGEDSSPPMDTSFLPIDAAGDGSLDSSALDGAPDGSTDSGASDTGSPDGSTDAVVSDAMLPPGWERCVPLPPSGSDTIGRQLLVSSAVWHRPDGTTCPATLDTTESYYVEPIVLCNGGPTAVSVDLTLVSTELNDPYMTIYTGAELPADLSMCLFIDDNSGAGVGDAFLGAVPIPAGSAITVAASSYEPIGSGRETGLFHLIVTRL